MSQAGTTESLQTEGMYFLTAWNVLLQASFTFLVVSGLELHLSLSHLRAWVHIPSPFCLRLHPKLLQAVCGGQVSLTIAVK